MTSFHIINGALLILFRKPLYGKLFFWRLLFWKPNVRCLSWLILNSFMNIKTPKARNSMELLFLVESTKSSLCCTSFKPHQTLNHKIKNCTNRGLPVVAILLASHGLNDRPFFPESCCCFCSSFLTRIKAKHYALKSTLNCHGNGLC